MDNVEGVSPGGVALVLKVHHALLDGATGAHLLSILHDLRPEGSHPVEVGQWVVDRVPTQFELLGRAGVNGVRSLWERGRVVARYTLPVSRGLFKRAVKGCNGCALMHAPKTRFNGKVSPHRVFEAVGFDLKTLNKIRDAFPEVTVNDVIVSVVSGALRRYLIHKDELPEQSLTAMLPVNIDPALSGAQGNNLSLMVPKIHAELAHPVDRLKAVQEAVAEAKHRNLFITREQD
ncbi:hypothetical protein M3P05_17575 [Sansalvadorimonas sp. 2012CJ34-2]|uniref:diacylglycerol O-acyltransferase n=1 Tax=Parendozoicomonas callyspongiae TaxID=2942213 RepID=A0ABT0PLX7_9GAMM|nr:hypothetical protein [Sansalvadorimonas sp. 2012CJ34-2]